jgi:hypothetical protein
VSGLNGVTGPTGLTGSTGPIGATGVIPPVIYAQALRVATAAAVTIGVANTPVNLALTSLPITSGGITNSAAGLANVPAGFYLISYGITFELVGTAIATSGLYNNNVYVPGTSTTTRRSNAIISVSNTSICNFAATATLILRIAATTANSVQVRAANSSTDTAAYLTVLKLS